MNSWYDTKRGNVVLSNELIAVMKLTGGNSRAFQIHLSCEYIAFSSRAVGDYYLSIIDIDVLKWEASGAISVSAEVGMLWPLDSKHLH